MHVNHKHSEKTYPFYAQELTLEPEAEKVKTFERAQFKNQRISGLNYFGVHADKKVRKVTLYDKTFFAYQSFILLINKLSY